MNLRTDLLKRHDGAHVLGVGKESACGPDVASGEPEVIHDAYFAHALFKAMEEWWTDVDTNDLSPAHSAVSWIGARAAELMREWGFEEKVTP